MKLLPHLLGFALALLAMVALASLVAVIGLLLLGGSPAIAAQGELVGQVVVAGTNARGEISTGVFVIRADEPQPVTFAKTLEHSQRVSDPSGRFQFTGLPDGSYLVALENTLLGFSETYSDKVSIRVGAEILTLPAQRVTLKDGRQDKQLIFRVTPQTASRKPPLITAPITGGEIALQNEESANAYAAPRNGSPNFWVGALAGLAGLGLLFLMRVGHHVLKRAAAH